MERTFLSASARLTLDCPSPSDARIIARFLRSASACHNPRYATRPHE